MFGSYKVGKSFTFDAVEIKTSKKEGVYWYVREGQGSTTKTISSASAVIINPIEPVTQPREVTHYLLIELKTPVTLSPDSNLTIYVTFPVEVGVYLSEKEKVQHIDSFTLTNPKYTLYGTPEKGLICKWWESEVFDRVPEVVPSTEGIMKVSIQNTSGDWAELENLVFDAYYMKIYYKKFACMNAEVKVLNNSVRTSFVDHPILKGMEKAIELFRLRKIPIVEKSEFVMELGL